VAEEGKQVIYDHKSILERKIECQKCHGGMSVGDGHAPKERCSQCHAEEEKIQRYNDAELMHKNHVTDHKIECRNCHTEIQHKSVSRSELVKPDCRACHSEFHKTQLNMFAGKGGRHVPEHPSSMFEAGLNCQGCHIIHIPQGEFELNGKSSVSNASVCDTCHGKGYSRLLKNWSAQTKKKMGQLQSVISTAKNAILSVRAHRNLDSSKNKITDATFNYNLVKHGRSVHNITYANLLMQKSYDLVIEAVKDIGLNVQLPYFEKSSVIPGECSNCHSGIERKTRQVFGWNFPHYKHVTSQKMVCAKCHSNEGKHGQMIMKRNDCMSCHHQHAQENCTDCHSTQLGIYKSELEFSTLNMPNPMVNDISCQNCHITEDKRLIRPKVDSCIACHDEDYAEIYNEWLEQSAELMSRLREKIKEHNLGKDSNASKLLSILEEDGSRGIHNPDLYQQLIEDALK